MLYHVGVCLITQSCVYGLCFALLCTAAWSGPCLPSPLHLASGFLCSGSHSCYAGLRAGMLGFLAGILYLKQKTLPSPSPWPLMVLIYGSCRCIQGCDVL